jgi:hypothetical protein
MIPIELIFEPHPGEVRVRPDAGPLLSALPSARPLLFFGWRPDARGDWTERARAELLALVAPRPAEVAICAHAGGPPLCWCRPPLPGLWLRFARTHGVDAREAVLVVASSAHRAMASAIGASPMRWPPEGTTG